MAIGLLSAVPPVHAKLPEPDVIFYGSLSHRSIVPFAPQNEGSHALVARLDGVIVAQQGLSAGAASYKLHIPMDDGTGIRLPGTARLGERIQISVRLTASGREFPAVPPTSEGFPLPSGGDTRGFVIPMALFVTEDVSDTSGGRARFAQWAASFGMADTPEDGDADGDGMANLSEYVSGTNPVDAGEVLHIAEIRRVSDVSAIRFGPVRHNRRYRIWCAPSLALGPWAVVGDIVPDEAAEWRWFDHPVPGHDSLFYRLTVDFQ